MFDPVCVLAVEWMAREGEGGGLYLLIAPLGQLVYGQRAADGGAGPGRGVDAEGAADRGQPVGHALQAGAVRGLRDVEAVAVVGDGES